MKTSFRRLWKSHKRLQVVWCQYNKNTSKQRCDISGTWPTFIRRIECEIQCGVDLVDQWSQSDEEDAISIQI